MKTEYATLEHLCKELPSNATKELTDLPVDKFAAMYNTNTGVCFVVHHDRQKGVGIKINYSHNMIRSVLSNEVEQMRYHIPCYYYYKGGFDSCDRFNRNLHDRSWPHSRGGSGTKGDFLNQHDFAMAVLLQNVFAVFNEMEEVADSTKDDQTMWKYDGTDKVTKERVDSFCSKCLRLADEIFVDSLNLIPSEYLYVDPN